MILSIKDQPCKLHSNIFCLIKMLWYLTNLIIIKGYSEFNKFYLEKKYIIYIFLNCEITVKD